MNILLVRHGETAWNREGRYQGRTDIPLSETGQTQVAGLGKRLANIPIKIAYASPLSRAKNTAEAILAGRSPVTPLWLDAGLLEISHGEWEGQLASDVEISHAEMFGVWRSAPGRNSPAGPGAETLGDVETRAWAVLANVCADLGDGDTALIAAHDAVNRVILCRVLGIPLERIWSFRQAPASLNVLAGPSVAELQVVRLNDSEHVAPLLQEAKHRAV
jgi:probable phosphoglycerate mutase